MNHHESKPQPEQQVTSVAGTFTWLYDIKSYSQVRGHGVSFPYPRIHRQLRWPGDDVSCLVSGLLLKKKENTNPSGSLSLQGLHTHAFPREGELRFFWTRLRTTQDGEGEISMRMVGAVASCTVKGPRHPCMSKIVRSLFVQGVDHLVPVS